MSKTAVRVCFASTPADTFNIGDARTAMLNWLYARRHKGTFLLRVEDMELSLWERRHESGLLEALKWLGIGWDEGPDIGGPSGPYRQSERLEVYQEYVKLLTDKGLVYPCYCTDEELIAHRNDTLARGVAPRYSGKCRDLTEANRRQLEAEGRKPAIRFRVGNGSIRADDLIRGQVMFDASLIGDFIIVRSSGLPAQNFAAVVDDALMEVSVVIRGEEDFSDTPRQIQLYEALGFDPPQFAHHPLLTGPDRTRLKGCDPWNSVEQLKGYGLVPEAVINYLAWVGGGLKPGSDILSRTEILETFDLARGGGNSAVFDQAKLVWMNTLHLRRLPAETILDYWLDIGVGRMLRDRDKLLEAIPLVIDNVERLGELESLLEIFTERTVAFSMDAEELVRQNHGRKALKALSRALEKRGAPRSKEEYLVLIEEIKVALGCEGKDLFMPIRAALTGETTGPELEKILCNLDKNTLLHRIERALGLTDL